MKNQITTIILSLTVIISALILGNAYKNRTIGNHSISVTGLGEENFTSDLIVWQAGFSSTAFELKKASDDLKFKREKIRKYLINKGVSNSELVFNSVSIQKLYNNTYDNMGNVQSSYFSGYSLNQTLRIESKEVDKIEKISREITELINQDIELDSYSPEYYYTKLGELKLKMIENATRDAKTRAEKIAINAGTSIGKLKNASMGVIQITARNSSEEYSWGGSFNTTSKLKTANITIRLEYDVD